MSEIDYPLERYRTDEHLLSAYSRLCDGLSNMSFVAVSLRGIHMSS